MAAESSAANVIVLGDRVRAAAFAFKREFIPIALESSPATTIVKISVLSARLKDAAQRRNKGGRSEPTALGSHGQKSRRDLFRCFSQGSSAKRHIGKLSPPPIKFWLPALLWARM